MLEQSLFLHLACSNIMTGLHKDTSPLTLRGPFPKRSSHLGIHKQTNIFGVYLHLKQSSATSKSAESGNYETFVVVHIFFDLLYFISSIHLCIYN